MAQLEEWPTAKLEAKRDEYEAAGDWERFERAETELANRESPDPADVAAMQDAQDADAGLEDRSPAGYYGT